MKYENTFDTKGNPIMKKKTIMQQINIHLPNSLHQNLSHLEEQKPINKNNNI